MASRTFLKVPAAGADARARTVPTPRTGWAPIRFLRQLGTTALDDHIADVGAMLAYYTVLAMFPMLVFIVTVALLVIPSSTLEEGIAMATAALPRTVAELVANQVRGFVDAAGAGFAIGSAAIALWGASRGATALGTALNAIFNKPETRSFLRRQAIAIAVTFGIAILIVIALGLLVIGPLIGHHLADRLGLGAAFDMAWVIGRWVGAGLLVMFVWAVVYKLLPDTDAPFRIFTPGAIVGVLLWLGISYLFGLYLGHFGSYEATYGALGGAIIFLTWLWLSNIALLFGAEINDVLADFRAHEREAADALTREPEPPPAPPSGP